MSVLKFFLRHYLLPAFAFALALQPSQSSAEPEGDVGPESFAKLRQYSPYANRAYPIRFCSVTCTCTPTCRPMPGFWAPR